MISHRAAILAVQLALATALAFGAAEVLRMMGVPKFFVLPTAELIWAGMVLFFVKQKAQKQDEARRQSRREQEARRREQEEWAQRRRDAREQEAPMQQTAEQRRPREWWEILEVSPKAGLDEVRRAYLRKVQMYHPDRLVGLAPELVQLSESRTRELNLAFEQAKRSAVKVVSLKA